MTNLDPATVVIVETGKVASDSIDGFFRPAGSFVMDSVVPNAGKGVQFLGHFLQACATSVGQAIPNGLAVYFLGQQALKDLGTAIRGANDDIPGPRIVWRDRAGPEYIRIPGNPPRYERREEYHYYAFAPGNLGQSRKGLGKRILIGLRGTGELAGAGLLGVGSLYNASIGALGWVGRETGTSIAGIGWLEGLSASENYIGWATSLAKGVANILPWVARTTGELLFKAPSAIVHIPAVGLETYGVVKMIQGYKNESYGDLWKGIKYTGLGMGLHLLGACHDVIVQN